MVNIYHKEKNIGGRETLVNLEFLEVTNGLIMATEYKKLSKFEEENFGNLPTLRHCFLLIF